MYGKYPSGGLPYLCNLVDYIAKMFDSCSTANVEIYSFLCIKPFIVVKDITLFLAIK